MNYTRKGVRKKQQILNSKKIKFTKMIKVTLLKVVLIVIIAFGTLGISMGVGAFNGILSSAPDITTLDVVPEGYATTVYDSEGHEITKLVAENSNRSYVTMDKIPQDLADAFVAIEDERFYEHNGVDIKGIIRAGYATVSSGFSRKEGASTITQQLLKNNVFEDWVNESNTMAQIKRKVQEQYLALQLEKELSKEEILETWANYAGRAQELDLPSAPKQFLHYFTEDNLPQTKLQRDLEGGMAISIGRLREDTQYDYKFVCLSHNTLRGAAGGGVLLAELLCAEGFMD